MTRTSRLVLAAILIASPTLVTFAQLNVAPPATQPETPRPPSATMPTTKSASTMPSAESVLENLINDKPNQPRALPAPAPAATSPNLVPAIQASAPNEPKAIRRREGDYIERKTGRLVRDDKTGSYLFAFDSDGKQMYDPPINLLPCLKLMSMEESSEKGARTIKFKISGEVTEFHGQNYLLLRDVLIVRDLNQGLGG
jgi:hypothetical protein